MVIGDTGSVEGIHAFIHCKKWRSGQVLPMPDRLTLKDRATQLLIKYKSGALVTQIDVDKFFSRISFLFDTLSFNIAHFFYQTTILSMPAHLRTLVPKNALKHYPPTLTELLKNSIFYPLSLRSRQKNQVVFRKKNDYECKRFVN